MKIKIIAKPTVINPIVDINNVILGNQSAEHKPTHLDKVSVRRLTFYLAKAVRAEFRNAPFRKDYDFVDQTTKIMESIRERKGVTDYTVTLSENCVKIGIQPLHSMNWLEIIVPTGSSHNSLPL